MDPLLEITFQLNRIDDARKLKKELNGSDIVVSLSGPGTSQQAKVGQKLNCEQLVACNILVKHAPLLANSQSLYYSRITAFILIKTVF